MSRTNRCGECSIIASGVKIRCQYSELSVVPANWSSAHRLACVTIARKRSVCPATQLAM